MTYKRRNVWELGSDWNDTVLWYARAVGEVGTRPIADRTSWRFLGAMHGIDEGLWQAFGYLQPTDPLPPQSDQDSFWAQCQHQSWYFLPWHRGYLQAFESILRAAVVQLGGPSDWALPYWNYSKAGQNGLPPAFAAATMPDGTPNPLKVAQRYGSGTGPIVVNPNAINLNALNDPDFGGASSGGSPGFGGVETDFSHDGDVNGDLENQPHNVVHGQVGGRIPNTNPNDGRNYGLMSMPDTAALDPIFWLHHANIDRLWEVWLKRDPSHQNETEAHWLNGPTDRNFVMPGADGSANNFTPADVATLANLDYCYDDVSDPLPGPTRRVRRLVRLGVAPAETEAPMAVHKTTELVGAAASPVRLGGSPVQTSVPLDTTVTRKVTRSLAAAAEDQEPDRIYLNLENVRGANDAASFRVYVNLPEGADPDEHPERLAGTIGLFGVRKATQRDSAHGGNGLTYVLDITDIVDQLHLEDELETGDLKVRIVPEGDVRDDDDITVGRISIYREGQ